MIELDSLDSLVVKQQKEFAEIITGFETKNRYIVSSAMGKKIYDVEETGGFFLIRMFLKALRPFTLTIRGDDGSVAMVIKRPFRFYFHEVEISDGDGNLLGYIKRNFAILRRKYSIIDIGGNTIADIFGPLLHPWTFNIIVKDNEVGKITKKWSGLLQEGFTDADNFGVHFPMGWTEGNKALLLGALFLIDFVHFENKG
jgi:uncharacterized protein YxjI